MREKKDFGRTYFDYYIKKSFNISTFFMVINPIRPLEPYDTFNSTWKVCLIACGLWDY